MKLSENQLTFEPGIDPNGKENLLTCIQSIMADITHQAELFDRIKTGEDANYVVMQQKNMLLFRSLVKTCI